MIIIKPINKFKTYKYDAAPFFFFIDIFPPDYSNVNKPILANLVNSIGTNPIMPLPMRVDRVFNGERSVLIRPKEPVSFPITEDLTTIIDPLQFLKFGFEKLLYFTEVRSREQLFLSVTLERVSKWWQFTRYLYANLSSLEEDFSAFLRAYMHTIIRAKVLGDDLIEAATEYCQILSDLCRKRLEQNSIIAEVEGKQEYVKIYKEKEATYYRKFKKSKETEYHPELIDIEIFNLSKIGFSLENNDRTSMIKDFNSDVIKYIPILFYDDLLECMLQNMKRIEEGVKDLIDPSFLLDKGVILAKNTKELENINMENYSWWNNFDNIKFEPFLESIKKIQKEFIRTLVPEEFKPWKRRI
ncbi:MAG: hypothetical protein ACFFAI_06940 [Promethearchaeota archaeon]